MSPSNSENQTPRRKRISASLSQILDRKLLGYAAAAGAAGVALMALAQPSEAEIVFTPANHSIKPRQTFDLDLNGDGVTDFTLRNDLASCGSQPPGALAGPAECSEFMSQHLYAAPAAGNGVVVGSVWASALPLGKVVGPANKFGTVGSMDQCFTQNGVGPTSSGPWLNVNNRYLGLKFLIDGETHFGWARFSVTTKAKQCAQGVVLTGYAYETEAGKPIATGRTSGADKVSEMNRPQIGHVENTPPAASLGMLAFGSAGLVAWRRDQHED
jgi:hypothetical protein